jgi:sugar lactone lactonase YvrE
VSLPLYQLADMKVDGSHQKIFLSMPAGADGRVVVTDYNGKSTWLGGLPGASGLALSPDNQTVYVAARDLDTIVAYDTTTLTETARYHVGDGTAP